jgi:hypothetical protein
MHRSLIIHDVLHLLACKLVESELEATAVSLACCCKTFEDPILDELWKTQDQLIPLLRCLPQEVWEVTDGYFVSRTVMSPLLSALNNLFGKHLQRIPTKAEWSDFQKYARRMRRLKVDASGDLITPETFLALQSHAADKPFLPRLKSFECESASNALLPFIPLFLPPQITEVDIAFAEDTTVVAVASVINTLTTLCPDLECVIMSGLDRDPVIIDAASEMLLACNRDSLHVFEVDSPLTEKAREVVCRLPKLSRLWVAIKGHTLLPQVALPDLTGIDIEYDDHLDWLQGFRGATLGKLERVSFRSESEEIGDFLGAFAKVALTTSAQNTLSEFEFCTSQSWTPGYYSLLPFKQLKELDIEWSCYYGCSSTVDDDVITALAQAMPKLEVLRLGRVPCGTPTGATVHGLIVLASYCLNLSKLQIHFQGHTLVGTAATFPTTNEPVIPQEGCALTDLEAGDISIPAQSMMSVAQMLLQIFPHILNVEGSSQEWETVGEHIKDFRRAGALVRPADSITFNNPERPTSKRKWLTRGTPVAKNDSTGHHLQHPPTRANCTCIGYLCSRGSVLAKHLT